MATEIASVATATVLLLSRGSTWCFQTTSPLLGRIAKRVFVPAIVAPGILRSASEAGPTPLDP